MVEQSIKMPNDFTVLILAGGKGERLQPLTFELQKCMIEVQGKPFLEYVVSQIHSLGITNIVFCGGYKSEFILKHFGTMTKDNKKFFYSIPSDFLKTGSRIIAALPYISTENIIIFNGDSLCNINPEYFWGIYDNFIKSESYICKLLIKGINSLLSSFINENNKYFGAGIYFLKTKFIKSIEYNLDVSLENDIIIPNYDKTIFVRLPQNFFVIDIGTHENLKILNDKETKFGRFLSNTNRRIADEESSLFS